MKRFSTPSFTSVLLILLFSFMLISPKQVFSGAKYGLLLWFQTVLPTLLPFSLMSNILLETNALYYISHAFAPIIRPLFKVSSAGVFVIVIGFLCGYPLGAKVISELYQSDRISYDEAEYLLSFCNNVSPIFIINYLVIFSFQNVSLLLPVLMILMGSPVLCSFIFRFDNSQHKAKETHHIPNISAEATSLKPFHLTLFNKCMMDSFEMMVYLGGYIMAFSILFSLLSRCTFLPFLTYALPYLEVTNGISYIQTMPLSFALRFLFTLAVTSFGGLCAVMQTQLVISDTNLSIRKYAIKKLVTMLVTSLLSYLYLLFFI